MRLKTLLLALLAYLPSGTIHAQETEVIYLSGTGFDRTVKWDFFCTAGMNSGQWTSIEVPSCWEQQGFGQYNYGHVPFEERLKEEGHYRYFFDVQESWKGKRLKLVFEGVMTDARVLINGREAGPVHQGAFYPFSFDISSMVKYGKQNRLEVFVKKFSDNASVNEAERRADYWIFGGIFRPVLLEIRPPVHIMRVAIDADADGHFTADVFLEGIDRAHRVEVEIRAEDGRIAGNFSSGIEAGVHMTRIHGKAEDPRLWNPEFPSLYTATFTLLDQAGVPVHRLSERIGFRTVEVRAQDGIYVNGERVKLKGVCRHSFHPEHGRTSSKDFSIEVVNLIKDMNMNAVRMSHYPPDEHFLDVCDSLGLLVLDELAGWQRPAYDSAVGRRLLEAMITRDVNHPSVIMWDNGNEGGWNTAYDRAFKELDIQQREVTHPWGVHELTNTAHYVTYDYLAMDHFAPREVFFPTEMIHGLYDGGLGAGLEDFWLRMWENPLSAGGFLWVFADESVRRTDTGELDSDGNHAPDGILGPYHEKEGSFYAIREIWSPVHFEKRYITPEFNGKFRIQNRFHYTSLEDCSFRYEWLKFRGPGSRGSSGEGSVEASQVIESGIPRMDALQPGQHGMLEVGLFDEWQSCDALYLEAVDPHGRLINTWSWPVRTASLMAAEILPEPMGQDPVSVSETGQSLVLESGAVRLEISKKNGMLLRAESGNKLVPLFGGPVFAEEDMKLQQFSHRPGESGHHVIVAFEGDARLEWIFYPGGLLDMNLAYHPESHLIPHTGASFSFPESDSQHVTYLGKGPYRVWKNRMKGGTFNVWTKEHNNTITGHSGYDYPEYKGYYANLYWLQISERDEHLFTVYSRTDDLFLRLFTPEEAPVQARTAVEHPPGDLGFMLGIPAIGTKFKDAHELGPQSGMYHYDRRRVKGAALQIELTFDFR